MIAVISPACLHLREQLVSGRAAHVAALSSTPTAGRLPQAVILLFFFCFLQIKQASSQTFQEG